MYDAAWFNDPIPAAQPKPEPGHKRRVSLLKQPDEPVPQQNGLDGHIDTIEEAPEPAKAPPRASVARRAQSYSDFYHIVKTQLRKDKSASETQQRQRQRRSSEVSTEDGVFDHDAWYEEVAHGLLDTSHERYRLYEDQLRHTRSHLDALLADTSHNIDILSHLASSFRAIQSQTSAFQGRCESLLSEQHRLASLADDVGTNLQYYSFLDPITRRLNAPGAGHFVRSDDFSNMLAQLDDCIAYMASHPEQRESATYGARYRLLLTRGLTLIRHHFSSTLRETAADVSKRIADRQLNETTTPTLLYAKFRVGAADMKALGHEIQKRAVPSPDAAPGTQAEYQSLVNELHQSYSAARGRLIVPLVRAKMAALAANPATSKDLVVFARSSIAYMRGICLDEYELWHEWFAGDDGLYAFLEAMCEPLYDQLRPRTIRETQLPKLCEMCGLLQVRYMDEASDDELEPAELPDQLDFTTLIRAALEDAQTRLVFVALAVLRDDIERFKPTPDDLNYPARNRHVALSGTRSKPSVPGRAPTSGTKGPDDPDALDLDWQTGSEASYRGWYPTLRKAIWLLSRIYRLVNSTVFDSLAHQIVHHTTLSLTHASTLLSARTTATPTGPADAHLFLLSQLLTLKSQIVAFDIEFAEPELTIDFATSYSALLASFAELRAAGPTALLDPRSLLTLVGNTIMPKVVENMLDAKTELDGRLRAVITEFTLAFAGRMTAPLAAGRQTAAGGTFDAGAAVGEARTAVEAEVRLLRGKLDEYIEDVRTKETLVGAVQDAAVAEYEDFFERHMAHVKGKGGGGVSRKGKGREDEVWDPDTFADWSADVFGVGMGDGQDGGELMRSLSG